MEASEPEEPVPELMGPQTPHFHAAHRKVTPSNHKIRNDEIEVLVRTVPVGHRDRSIDDLEARAGMAMRSAIKELLASEQLVSAA